MYTNISNLYLKIVSVFIQFVSEINFAPRARRGASGPVSTSSLRTGFGLGLCTSCPTRPTQRPDIRRSASGVECGSKRSLTSYLNPDETDVNVAFSEEPIPRTVRTMTIDRLPAMIAYSIAVAAVSFLRNNRKRCITGVTRSITAFWAVIAKAPLLRC
jgi:hypothetical protein